MLSNASISDTKWHHVAVVYNGSSLASGFDIIVDGVNEPVVVAFDALTGTTVTNVNLHIGNFDEDCCQHNFIGEIDEVRIWSLDKTENEIRENIKLALHALEVLVNE